MFNYKENKFFKSVSAALQGFPIVYKERNFRIHTCIGFAVILFGIYFKINRYEWIAVFFAIGITLMAEIMNTSIENLTDLVMPEKNQKAGIIKDLAALAVLFCAIMSALIGFLVFYPYLEF